MIKSIIKIAFFAVINVLVLCLILIPLLVCVKMSILLTEAGIVAALLFFIFTAYMLVGIQFALFLVWWKLMKFSIKSIMAD